MSDNREAAFQSQFFFPHKFNVSIETKQYKHIWFELM